jgi:hypothetical protein
MNKKIYEPYIHKMAAYLFTKISSSKRSADKKGKKHGRKDDLDVNVDVFWLENKLKEIECRCQQTGTPFPLLSKYPNTEFEIDMYMPSVDRIDSSLPYLRDNIKIVCTAINKGKGAHSENQSNEFWKLIQGKTNLYEEVEHTIYEEIKNKNVKENVMTKEQTNLNLDLVAALIQNGYYDEATKYFNEYGVHTKVTNEKTIKSNTKKIKSPKKDTLAGPAKIRKGYLENNSTELDVVDETEYLTLKNLLGRDENNKIYSAPEMDIAIKNKIHFYKKRNTKGQAGWIYYINKEDENKLFKLQPKTE